MARQLNPTIVHCPVCKRDIDARGYGRHLSSKDHLANVNSAGTQQTNHNNETTAVMNAYRQGYRDGRQDHREEDKVA